MKNFKLPKPKPNLGFFKNGKKKSAKKVSATDQNLFNKIGGLFSRIKLMYFSAGYFFHLWIRMAHDKTYEKVPVYKKYSDKGYTSKVHKSVLYSFIISFVIFSLAQSVFPWLFNLSKPNTAQAGSNSYTWTTRGDFEAGQGVDSFNITGSDATSDGTLGLKSSLNQKLKTITAGGSHTVGLKDNGTVVAVGSNTSGQLNTGSWTGVKSVAAGSNHTVGLKDNGTVVAVGSNTDGQLNTGSWTGITSVAAGSYHTVGLKQDGTVAAVGLDTHEECDEYEENCSQVVDGRVSGVSSWTGIIAIAAGTYHTVGLKQDGTVVAVGLDTGQLGVGSWTGITAIAASSSNTIGLKQDGTVVGVGGYLAGIDAWTGITALSAGSKHIVGLKQDGTVVAVGSDIYGQLNIDTWTGISSIAAGSLHTVGLRQNGTVLAAGLNNNGQAETSSWTGIRQPSLSFNGPATMTGLYVDAGSKAAWASLSWNGGTPAGSSIKFRARSSETQAGLNVATWSSLNIFETSGASSGIWDLSQAFPNGAEPSVFLEIEITLATSVDSVTPSINDFTVSYDTLESPSNSTTTLTKSDDSTLNTNDGTQVTAGVPGGYTNETSLKVTNTNLTCTGCSTTATGLKMEVQYAEVGTAFPDETTGVVVGDSTANGDGTFSSTAILTGLSSDTSYHLRMRSKDDQGRVSGWTSYGGNTDTSASDFSIEQSVPSGSFTFTGDNITGNYAKSTSVQLAITATDTGGSVSTGTPSQMRISNDGDFNSPEEDWQTYDDTKDWTLSSGDGTKNVYIQFRDNAGNVSGIVHSKDGDFTTGSTSGTVIENDSIHLSGVSNDGWMSGVLGGTKQYYTNSFGLGSFVWNDEGNYWEDEDESWIYDGVNCTSPWCVGGTLVSAQTNPTVDFTHYPAQNACKNIGGTMGSANDLLSLYNNGVIVAPLTPIWTPTQYDADQVWSYGFDTHGNVSSGYFNKRDSRGMICVREAPTGAYVQTGGFVSAIMDANNSGSLYSKILFSSEVPNGTTLEVLVRAGNTANPDGTWTNYQAVDSGLIFALDENLKDKRYLQYKVEMTGGLDTPTLTSVVLETSISETIVLDATAPSIAAGTITSPNGADNKFYKGGTAKNITWTAENITDAGGSSLASNPISIKYSTDDGQNWADITGAQDIVNSGSFSWTPPIDNTTTAKIRIRAVDNAGNATTQDSVTFVVDSSAPTGSVVSNSFSEYYKTKSIDIPYISADETKVNLPTETLPAEWEEADLDPDQCVPLAGIGSKPSATEIRVVINMIVYGYLKINDTNFGDGVIDTGWVSGNLAQVCSTEDQVNIFNHNVVSAGSIYYRYGSVISGVDYTNLYYTRQTSAPYTWTKYNGDFDFTESPGTISFDSTATGDGHYGFKLVAVDNAGNAMSVPGTSTAPDATTFIDTVVPTAGASNVTNITPSPNNSGNQTITWGEFADASPSSGFKKYEVYRKLGAGGGWQKISSDITNSSTTTYTDGSTLDSGTYYYKIESYDNADNKTISDDSDPHIVDKITPGMNYQTLESPTSSDTWTGGMVRNIVWNASSITDNDGGSGLKGTNGNQAISLYYANIANPTSTDWILIDTNLNNGANGSCTAASGKGCYPWRLPNIETSTTMWVKIIASDNAGNPANIANLPSNNYDTNDAPFKVDQDTTAPQFTNPNFAVSPLYAGGGVNYTTPTTTLSWNAPTDEGSGVSELSLWVKQIGVDVSFRELAEANLAPDATSYAGNFDEGAWEWKLKAIDGLGVQDIPGHETFSPTYAMTTDGTAPTANLSISPLMLSGYTATSSSFVNLITTASDELSGYSQITFSNSPTGPWTVYQSALSYSSWDLSDILFGGTSTKGTKTVYYKVKDHIGNEGDAQDATIIWDDTVPAHPSNITFSSVNNLSSTFDGTSWSGNSYFRVNWSAASDSANPESSGIHHYTVYRKADTNNPDGAVIVCANTANTYCDDSSLIDGHTYYYWIQAADNAMNFTTYQNATPGSQSLSDITGPTWNTEPPLNFTASGISDSVIRLSFLSSVDNASQNDGKAARYEIKRTVAWWPTEPMGDPTTYDYLNDTANISYQQSPYYKGSNAYEFDDTVASGQWYYYKIVAYDAGERASSTKYYKSRGNYAPVFSQSDITVSVNNNHNQNTVAPGDTVTVNFKVTDADTREDLDTGNAAQLIKITNGSGGEELAYTTVSTKENYSANSLEGYSYTYQYHLPADADYGTYIATINVKDSVAIGDPGANAHNIVKTTSFKVPPQTPRNTSVSGYSSTKIQLNWDPPTNGGLRVANTYEVERKLASGGDFAVVGTTASTDYRDEGLTSNTAYVYRVRAFDISNNGGTYTEEQSITTPTPAIPAADSLELKDASTLSTSSYRILLLWGAPVAESGTTTNEVSKYYVRRSEDGGNIFYDLPGGRGETSNNYVVDTDLAAGTSYIYRVYTKDNFETVSASYRQITGSPGATPEIYEVGATGRTSTADITWKVRGQNATSQIVYSQNKDELLNELAATSSAGVGGYVNADQAHTVTVKGLEPGKKYYYRIISRNTLGIANTYANADALPSFNTTNFAIQHDNKSENLEGPLGGVQTTTEGAEVTWRTGNVPSDSFIEFYIENAPGTSKIVGDGKIIAANGIHRVKLPDLKANTTYAYYIKSKEENGLYTVTSEIYKLTTKAYDSSQFTIAPSASEVAEQNITATSAKIVWNTAVATLGCVEYDTESVGSKDEYPLRACDDQYNTTHVVELESLTPGKTYYYRVTGLATDGVTRYFSKEYSFSAVLQPEIQDLKVDVDSPYTAVITFNTNVDTDATLSYGKDGALSLKAGHTDSARNHRIELKDLEDASTYSYTIEVKDRSNSVAKSNENNFKTPVDTAGPKIVSSKIDILPLGDNDTTASAIITWTTDRPATTKIEYDEGVIGGRYSKASVEDQSLATSHTVIIKDLNLATTYHYRINSKTKRGNATVSPDYTFVTPAKEQSVWQLIVKSLQDTFSWTQNLGNIFKRR